MSALLRSNKDLPPALSSERAWIDRLRDEPAHIVLADAYAYGLWYYDRSGVPTMDDSHPLVESACTVFLHSSPVAYDEALVELARRAGVDPYARLAEEAEAVGISERMVTTTRVVTRLVDEADRARRA